MVRFSMFAAAAVLAATVSAAPLEVAVRQATAAATPTATVSAQPTQTARPTPRPSTDPNASNAPTSPTPSVTPSTSVSVSPGTSPIPPSASPSTGAPASAAASVVPDAPPSTGTIVDGTTTVTDNTFDLMESPMASPAQDPPAPVCFPADSTVLLENGSTKRMDQVIVGDRVAVGSGIFSEVFMFTHKLSGVTHDFVSIKTASGSTIRMTEGHYIPLNGAYRPAREAKVGDIVTVSDGSTSPISEVSSVTSTGLFNPQTAHGDIIVDGVLASTYTTAVERKMAHALLAPLRLACDRLGFSTSMLNAGSDYVASFTSVFA